VSSRASSQALPQSPGNESFFPTPVSPVSFFNTDDDDADGDLDDDPLVLDYEPAPAYEPAPYAPRARSISAATSSSGAHTQTRGHRARAASSSTIAAAPAAALLADDDDDDEDPWVAFAAVCWAAFVEDDPHNPPAYAFGRHTFVPGSVARAQRRHPAPAPMSESEPESADAVVGAPELLLAPMRYNPAFARTEPDLAVGVWGARGDNAIAHALGLEDDLLDFDLDVSTRLAFLGVACLSRRASLPRLCVCHANSLLTARIFS
jgi:hypothetical protein